MMRADSVSSAHFSSSTAPKKNLLQVKDLDIPAAQKIGGVVAALMMVVVWSGYFLSLRMGAVSAITTFEIAVLRFCIPGFLLLPVFIHHRQQIFQVPKLYLAGLFVGGGLPFFWLGAVGMQMGQVAEGSTLIPGVAPLFVTGIAVVIFNQPLSRLRLLGLSLIFVGVVAFVANSISGNSHVGAIVCFLSASFFWALFALSIRQSGLSPLVAASVVTVPTGCLLLLSGLVLQPELGWQQLPMQALFGQVFAQGIGAGLASGLLFAYAISRLGAEVTSAIGSLTPVGASLIAFLWLGEQVTSVVLIGIALISVGVIFASGLIKRNGAK
ncbi:DMT family transporter [Oceanospirillum maris]|uniref:DMT family transporter n=1 Tax=Oceanospirillum maris TaxID=64977 RepID=UPI00041FFAD3|nr:DMT family transporter [Oceanospirillum maris]